MHILGTTFFFITLLKACLGVYLQWPEAEVYIGESVILSCNGSGFSGGELYVRWEATGKDVITLRGDAVSVGRGFEGRVNFLRDPAESGDFSLVLSDVMLNDGEVYECLWEGIKPICFVELYVLTPAFFNHNVAVFEGDTITLDCFGNIPKNKPWEDIYVQWLKDGREILRFGSGETSAAEHRVLRLPDKHELGRGVFSLSVPSVRASDSGVYECRYKRTHYEELQNGFPEKLTLMVWAVSSVSVSLSQSQESSSVLVWTQTESSGSLPTLTYTERDGATTETSVTKTATHSVTTDPSVTDTEFSLLVKDTDSVTTDISVPADTASVMTDPSVPDTGTGSGQRDPLELRSDEVPWIRVALISGVLLVTAVVLALLLVFERI
ncbi:uncharacterized protein LOC122343461 [Puntigrus tetrazona]|uniref:uncharacterized protein LOC122343461 n=1 Tax=Puntigrus tetrazona TaxID=1606681 RepID=UPI001C89A6D0|nr:uncharacterized protein LOC122343461 [Puntigrus tetrazona]